MRKSTYDSENSGHATSLGRYNQSHTEFHYTHTHLTADSTNISEDGNGDNQSEGSNQQMPPHPANITLERPGYFTIPSLQELAAQTDTKGKFLKKINKILVYCQKISKYIRIIS